MDVLLHKLVFVIKNKQNIDNLLKKRTKKHKEYVLSCLILIFFVLKNTKNTKLKERKQFTENIKIINSSPIWQLADR